MSEQISWVVIKKQEHKSSDRFIYMLESSDKLLISIRTSPKDVDLCEGAKLRHSGHDKWIDEDGNCFIFHPSDKIRSRQEAEKRFKDLLDDDFRL